MPTSIAANQRAQPTFKLDASDDRFQQGLAIGRDRLRQGERGRNNWNGRMTTHCHVGVIEVERMTGRAIE